jgi:quercetin dioxygenase-like cupin family protein
MTRKHHFERATIRRAMPSVFLLARFLMAMALLSACGKSGARQHDSAFSAASGVARAADASTRTFHIAPLRPMSGDVEMLTGDPEKPGEPFVMRIRELPGTMIPLHSHPVDEHITVVQGTWYFAVGDKWDESALKALHAGDYAFAPKGATMFGYCPDGAIVQIHGVGPFVIHWLHGAKTLADPDAAGTFRFRRADRVKTPRGEGVIREGYASGDIVQYEIETATGARFMANESDTHRM